MIVIKEVIASNLQLSPIGGANKRKRSLLTSFLFLLFCKTLMALRRSSIGFVNLGVATLIKKSNPYIFKLTHFLG
jgi:hypothetical protein